jgi:hypothetical protein
VINITVSTILVSTKVAFYLQQGMDVETVRLIAESCQHLKKLKLGIMPDLEDEDVIHIINNLAKQLATLVLGGIILTDVAFLRLNNCLR